MNGTPTLVEPVVRYWDRMVVEACLQAVIGLIASAGFILLEDPKGREIAFGIFFGLVLGFSMICVFAWYSRNPRSRRHGNAAPLPTGVTVEGVRSALTVGATAVPLLMVLVWSAVLADTGGPIGAATYGMALGAGARLARHTDKPGATLFVDSRPRWPLRGKPYFYVA